MMCPKHLYVNKYIHNEYLELCNHCCKVKVCRAYFEIWVTKLPDFNFYRVEFCVILNLKRFIKLKLPIVLEQQDFLLFARILFQKICQSAASSYIASLFHNGICSMSLVDKWCSNIFKRLWESNIIYFYTWKFRKYFYNYFGM